MFSMARLNMNAAKLMQKYKAHCATDVTGFGILGHATNLAGGQEKEVEFVIHTLPIIANMAAVYRKCGINFKLLEGHSAETSGWLSFTFSRFFLKCSRTSIIGALTRNHKRFRIDLSRNLLRNRFMTLIKTLKCPFE